MDDVTELTERIGDVDWVTDADPRLDAFVFAGGGC
jgi:hypothetical protein